MDIITSTIKDITEVTGTLGKAFTYVWFIFLPPLFYWAFKALWLDHVRRKYWNSVDKILLEIIPPQNIEKSPKLMESFFSGIHGVDTTIPNNERYLKGRFIEWFSFELVGDGGEIHFYVRTPRSDRGIIEANIYAQYPDAQVIEVDDYVDKVPRIVPNKEWEIWGADAKLTGADPVPIKTYHRFQEDITGKMIDPLSSIFEVLGKLGPNQKVWFQIIVNPVKESSYYSKAKDYVEFVAGRKDKPKTAAEKIIQDFYDIIGNIFKGFTSVVEFPEEKKKDQQPLEFRLTPGERDMLKSLEENVGKVFFETKIRFVYVGKKENYDKPGVVGGFWGAMKQFSDQNTSGIAIEDSTKTYAWYFMVKPRLRYRQRILFQRYIDRDWSGVTFKMSTAELATIFHPPDMSAMAPSIPRVEAKLGGAPANLPIKQ